ncbi:UNVERIFIED_CONTAM: hypothetical protein K2H54_018824 [Gekko kuhli]
MSGKPPLPIHGDCDGAGKVRAKQVAGTSVPTREAMERGWLEDDATWTLPIKSEDEGQAGYPCGSSPSESVSSTNHHESIKETSEVIRSEVKGKKSSSHGTSHKAKKSGSGKSSTGFSSSSSSGTFPSAGTSCSSLPFSQDFVTFPKLEQPPQPPPPPPEEEKYRKPTSSSSSSAHCSPLYEGQKGDVFEQKVIFSGFGSIMRFSTTAVSQQRGRDASPVDYKASNPIVSPPGGSGGSGGGSNHKRIPSLNVEEGEVLKEKKHKASKKNKHGPGRPKGSKNKEVPGAQLVGSTATSSSPFSGGSLVSSSIGGSSSRSFSHAASLPSLSLESPLLGSGTYGGEVRKPGTADLAGLASDVEISALRIPASGL